MKFIRPKTNRNAKGIKLLTRLRLGLSHLREHKFKHNFQDCLNPLCLCGNEMEKSTHHLLHCPTYTNERLTLLNKIKSINRSILESSDAAVTKLLHLGDNTLRITPSFWTEQLNTSYQYKDLKAPSSLPYNNRKALPTFYLLPYYFWNDLVFYFLFFLIYSFLV